MIQTFSFSFWKLIFSAKIRIKAQPYFIERIQASRNRPVSQKRPICLQLKRDAVLNSISGEERLEEFPGRDALSSGGLDQTGKDAVGFQAIIGAGSETYFSEDHQMPQTLFRVILGGRHPGSPVEGKVRNHCCPTIRFHGRRYPHCKISRTAVIKFS